ncbi:MAG: helix-turn-helix domain-containing protein [Trebonia sp.]
MEQQEAELRDGANPGTVSGAATRFLRELRQLRDVAGLGLAELAARAHYPRAVIEAAESGPPLPELPVLSAYVRGCGGTADEVAAWEDRWRSVTGAKASPLLPARDAGNSDAADAGARIGAASAAADSHDPAAIMAALDRFAETMATAPPPSAASIGSPADSSPSGSAPDAGIGAGAWSGAGAGTGAGSGGAGFTEDATRAGSAQGETFKGGSVKATSARLAGAVPGMRPASPPPASPAPASPGIVSPGIAGNAGQSGAGQSGAGRPEGEPIPGGATPASGSVASGPLISGSLASGSLASGEPVTGAANWAASGAPRAQGVSARGHRRDGTRGLPGGTKLVAGVAVALCVLVVLLLLTV